MQRWNDDDIENWRQEHGCCHAAYFIEVCSRRRKRGYALQFRNIANKQKAMQGKTPPMNIFNPACLGGIYPGMEAGRFKNKQ